MFLKRYRLVIILAVFIFMLSLVSDKYSPAKYTINGVIARIEKDIEDKRDDFNKFCYPPSFGQFVSDSTNENTYASFLSKDYYIFIYPEHSNAPMLWNTQMVAPDTTIVSSSLNHYVSKLSSGWYLVEKKILRSANAPYQVIALIPVKKEYYINNKYLKNSFPAVNGIDDHFNVTNDKTPYVIKDDKNMPLTYLALKGNSVTSYNNIVALILRLSFLFLLLYLMNRFAASLIREKGIFKAGIVLTLMILLLRSVSYFTTFPLNFRQFELFSPAIYGSDPVLRSLGDLFINISLVIWIVFFMKDYILKMRFQWTDVIYKRFSLITMVAILMISITLLAGYILNSLITDSQISFDVLNFFSLNFYTVIGFIILCGIAASYFFIMQILMHIIEPVIKENFYIPLVIIILASLVLLFMLVGSTHFVFYFSLLSWLLLFLLLLNNKALSGFKARIVSSRLVFWLFFFSASITTVLVFENKRKELDNRKHYLENLADKTDPSGERMMSITLADLKNDYLEGIFDRFKNKSDNYILKDSLLHENMPAFLNRYDTKIYTYDSSGHPLFNLDSTSLNTLNVIVETQSRPTSVVDLSYYDVSFERFNYITRKIIRQSSDTSLKGYLFIISSPKRYKSDELYPQLFNKGNEDAIENSPLYSYAIYINRFLVNSYNDYPFPTHLSADINFLTNFYERHNNGYSELWYKISSNKLAVITKPDNIFIEALTLFAYLFCVFLGGIIIINLCILLIRSRFSIPYVFTHIQLTIRNQVHGTIILISLISFFIIGITTILFFINRYNKNDHEKLSRTISLIESDVLNGFDSSFISVNDKSGNIQLVKNAKFEALISKVADIHESDINLYDLNGVLQLSSLPLPYNKGILSQLMDPLAFFHLKRVKDAQFFALQKIGALEYLNNYIPLKNKEGIEYGYLNIPYFQSENKLYEEISNFLVTIINLNAFIFLITGIIAFFITNTITNSFSLITTRMRNVNLGKTNELIEWNRKDEIGNLVKEYNRMVSKLEESAQDLARNEREGAWREMARQVAHEIKNPLTPMKLNLQYLQMAVDNKSANVANISMYVSKILVEQIDHLSQIASDFSQFANINHSHNQQFDLNEVLNKLFLLYANNNNVEVNAKLGTEPIFIYADKTQIQRLFTNLIQNAVQSIPENTKAIIIIENDIQENTIITSIKDNGSGIPVEMRQKIFTPNFTTKSSGTGLGLAMSKGIVEKIGGRIWFETSENQGTTFYVELPLDFV